MALPLPYGDPSGGGLAATTYGDDVEVAGGAAVLAETTYGGGTPALLPMLLPVAFAGKGERGDGVT